MADTKRRGGITRELIARLPKSDLHVHLDGSLRLDTLIELSKEHKVKLPSATPEGLLRTVFKRAYKNLPEYLKGFEFTVACLQDAEALERVFSGLDGRLGARWEDLHGLARIHPANREEPPGMTCLALRASRTSTGVSERHGGVARRLWRPLFGARTRSSSRGAFSLRP